MWERFQQHYSEAYQQRALALLRDPSNYPALAGLDSNDIVFQLYVLPCFQPLMSWTLYKHSEAALILRRVRWDFIADYRIARWRLTIAEPTTYGADVQCSAETVSSALAELSSLRIPAFDPASIIHTDGVTFGFRRWSNSQSLEFSWWGNPPEGCNAVAEWYHRFTDQLELLLPAHTDRLRLSAVRRRTGDMDPSKVGWCF